MIKIEKILEVTSISKASVWNPPAQYTHFERIDQNNTDVPYLSGFMMILPLGLTNIGKRFKVTVEEMDEL